MGRGSRSSHVHREVAPTAPAPSPAPGPAAGGGAGAVITEFGGRAGASAGRVGPVGEPYADVQPTSAAQEVLVDLAEVRQRAGQAQQRLREQWADPHGEVSYLNNPEAFQQAYDEARARRERGEPPISYMYEDATDGLGAREGGRAFGVEIEFDLSGADDDDALEAIARDLYDAGLSRYAYQGGYHSNMREGYSDAPNGWRLESDATVAGEIVSPIMYDEPQTWRNLEKVCEIVRRHGGVATYNTGGHVHVSLHDYDHTIDNHNRLLQLNAAYEDVLFRMAQNPAARQHRGTSWCRPNQVPAGGYRSVQEVSWRNAGHGLGLNLQAVNGGRQDHAEMRMWDGSLDPSVIQTQIKTSLALVAAASRGAEADQPERLGTHRQRNAHLPRGERLRGQAWLDDTRSFRQLMDTIYRRARDKAQATALFASTRWQRPR